MRKSNFIGWVLASILIQSTALGRAVSWAGNLTQGEAEVRARSIKGVSYEALLILEETTFMGRTVIRYSAQGLSQSAPLFLDFRGGQVQSLQLDGKAIEVSEAVQGDRIVLPASALTAGAHEVGVVYSHPYATDGKGLHRFVDPEDHRVYTYTHFEPFYANRVFPCFDQPDLKARWKLEVAAPSTWTVVANTLEGSGKQKKARKSSRPQRLAKVTQKPVSPFEKIPSGFRRWKFAETPPLATYAVAVIAGEYVLWSDAGHIAGDETKKGKAKRGHKIPLRLLARQSMKSFVPVKEWFETTRQGFAFFERAFQTRYPYEKYDQVLVPEFNAGAMENVAAVTFSERYLHRGQVTSQRLRSRASVILHEMAHMWFGNLVTLKWWNGLWLNESFATLLSQVAMDLGVHMDTPWQDFLVGVKADAYSEDQLPTTHAIEGRVPDVETTYTVFDGITYDKGASVLKQLWYAAGDKAFYNGLAQYFAKHAHGNTTVDDFVDAIGAAAEKDLGEWKREWLETTGVNRSQVEYECEDETLTRFVIHQGQAPEKVPGGGKPTSQLLREHHTRVALFDRRLGPPTALLHVTYSGESTEVQAAVGKACPTLVVLNDGDMDYSQTRLDSRSFSLVPKALPHIKSSFLRQQLLMDLWWRVENGEWPATEYARVMKEWLPQESDFRIVSWAANTLVDRSLGGHSVARILPPQELDAFLQEWEKLAWNQVQGPERKAKMNSGSEGSSQEKWVSQLTTSEEETEEEPEEATNAAPVKASRSLPPSGIQLKPSALDLKLTWFAVWQEAARSPQALADAGALLEGKKVISEITLDADPRWSLLFLLAREGDAQFLKRLEREEKRDVSDRGKKNALKARALWSDAAQKKTNGTAVLRAMGYVPAGGETQGSDLRLSEVDAVADHLWSLGQESLMTAWETEWTHALPALKQSQEESHQELFAGPLFPFQCSQEGARRIEKAVGSLTQSPVALKKGIEASLFEERRCAALRDLARSRKL